MLRHVGKATLGQKILFFFGADAQSLRNFIQQIVVSGNIEGIVPGEIEGFLRQFEQFSPRNVDLTVAYTEIGTPGG